MTQAMTTKGARRAPARAVSSFPLWCKGGKRSCGVSRHQAKIAISVQQDQARRTARRRSSFSPRRRHHQSFVQARTNFSQDKCTRCSPSKWPTVGALPAQYLGRGPGPLPINRTSHPQRGERLRDRDQGRDRASRRKDRIEIRERERRVTELLLAVRPPQPRTDPREAVLPCMFHHHQPKRQSTTPHTGVGYYTTTVARTSINPVCLVLFFP